jgi:hypothetical protein
MQSMWRVAASSRGRIVAALAALTLGVGVATVVAAAPALADPTAPISFTAAGIYTVTVPARAVAVTLVGVGGAGFAGDPSAIKLSPGGAGGSGTQVAESLPVNAGLHIAPGDTLTVVVGAKGGGGQRGYNGGNIGGNGGNGGGATSVRSPAALVLGAGGGGGGGGGGGAFTDEDGGRGGTNDSGQVGVESFGTPAGKGGALGDDTCDAGTTEATPGQAGETTSTFGNSGGGGGGGGEGFCGGGGGGSGDHGIGSQTGGSGGGGGGAGGSFFDYGHALDESITPATNTGDGSVTITFDEAPPATLSSTALTFAPQAIGIDSPSQLITITNSGDFVMLLDSIKLTGPDDGDFQLSPGSCGAWVDAYTSCLLAVTFDPVAAGPRTATITISDNHGLDVQTITLTGTGQAPAAASYSASSIDFGGVPVGTTTGPHFVTLTNTGDLPLAFDGLSLDGGDGGEFDGNTGTCGDVIAPHASCQVGAVFHPSARAADSSSLIVNTGAAGSPERIALTGAGQGPAVATLSATSIDFGGQSVGVISAPRYVTITNTGDLPLTVLGMTADGADPSDFSGLGHCPPTLVPGASCQVGGTFTPTVSGARSATFHVYDTADATPQTITLTGVGQTPAAASFSASSIDFGGQPIGAATASHFVTLTNTGDVPLPFDGLSLDGGDAGEFDGDPGTCGDEIAPHDSCQVGAVFHPSSRGAHSTTLIVNYGSTGGSQRITLTGAGQGPAIATLSATTITFPGQPVGVISAPQYITLTNTGDVPMSFSGIAAGGIDPADFSGLTYCAATIAPGDSCRLGGTFTPGATGARSATFYVYDSADATPQSITLTGTGITRPGAPTIGAAVAGNGTATIAFTAPSSDGGSPITGYTATATDLTKAAGGGQTATGTDGPLTVHGLTNGDRYTVTVTATNAVGTSSTSAASGPVTPTAPVAAPSAPRALTANAAKARVALSWTAPLSDGGSAITGYNVYQGTKAGGEGPTPLNPTPLPATTRSYLVKGLTNANPPFFTVRAINSAGESAASNEATLTPTTPLTVTTTSLGAGQVGAGYRATLTATGGRQPYHWSLAPGSTLPAGLTLDPSGAITGTPTRARSASLTVRLTDSSSPARTVTKQLALTVEPAARAADLKINATHLGAFVTGGYGDYLVTVSNTGTAPTTAATIVTIAVPSGLTYAGATGSGWSCGRSGAAVTCTHKGLLPASASGAIALVTRVTARAGRVLVATATVTPTDRTPADNTATDRVTVGSYPRRAI